MHAILVVMFDDERYDAEIILNRRGRRDFTARDIAEILNCHTSNIWKNVVRGRFPVPKVPGVGSQGAIWSQEQVIEMMILKKKRLPREHGTVRGARQHESLREEFCEPCRLALNKSRRQKYAKIPYEVRQQRRRPWNDRRKAKLARVC